MNNLSLTLSAFIFFEWNSIFPFSALLKAPTTCTTYAQPIK